MAYAGLYYHKATGLYLATYRAYDASVGRWLKRDPIEETGGINLYRYVSGDPVVNTDTLGLKDFLMRIWVGGSAGYAVVGGGAIDVSIIDPETGRSTLYTVVLVGIGVGLPSFGGSSEPIKFHVDDPCKTTASFSGVGYLGGINAEIGLGRSWGGGIKVPNGPFIPGSTAWSGAESSGRFSIGVSHSVTYWYH
jgi:RHS repeat-associated protein